MTSAIAKFLLIIKNDECFLNLQRHVLQFFRQPLSLIYSTERMDHVVLYSVLLAFLAFSINLTTLEWTAALKMN